MRIRRKTAILDGNERKKKTKNHLPERDANHGRRGRQDKQDVLGLDHRLFAGQLSPPYPKANIITELINKEVRHSVLLEIMVISEPREEHV